jgi:hypothetical protein
MQAGDIIFVRPAANDWAGQLVARATDGPYCHVRVAISHFEVVEALGRGVRRTTVDGALDTADVVPLRRALGGRNTSSSWMSKRQQQAFTWLEAQVGDAYGVWDIAGDALQLLAPRWLGSRTPFLVAPRSFDCSHLAATFAAGAGVALPLDVLADLPRVSPNSLARALGVLK